MNKRISIFLSIIVAAWLCFGVAGCKITMLELDEEKALEIKTAYFEKFNGNKPNGEREFTSPEEIEIYNYYGEYNQTYIVDLGSNSVLTWLYSIEVDGVKIQHNSANVIYAYNGGNFYTLDVAFEDSLLGHSDLVKISRLAK